jgi:NAD(P)-dependent dehydrogenase (short-subunit alcohol dehydrogenase family)
MDIGQMTVLVTGAASGIGQALANGFLDDGARVVGVDINADGLEPLANRGAVTLAVDVSDPAQVDDMVRAALDQTGSLEVLINNAGLGFARLVVDHKPEEFEQLLRVNLFGPFYCMRAAIPVMREGGFGRIINVVSRHAESGASAFAAYGSSKAGLWALTRHAASETRDENIRINCLIPGPTRTGMMPRGQEPELVYPTARMLATLPLDGPTGKVFWNEKEYVLFDPANESYRREFPRRR